MDGRVAKGRSQGCGRGAAATSIKAGHAWPAISCVTRRMANVKRVLSNGKLRLRTVKTGSPKTQKSNFCLTFRDLQSVVKLFSELFKIKSCHESFRYASDLELFEVAKSHTSFLYLQLWRH